MKFDCPFCGKSFDDPNAFAEHIHICNEQRKAKEKSVRRKKLDEEKQHRKEEINKARESLKVAQDKLRTLVEEYNKDYPVDNKPLEDIMDLLFNWRW